MNRWEDGLNRIISVHSGREQMDEMTISPEVLTSLVSQALGEPSVQLGEWGVERLKGGLETDSTILRLAGMAKVAGKDQR